MLKGGKVKPMKFLEAVNKLIEHYNGKEFSNVIYVYENISKKLGPEEKRYMTKEILPEIYVCAAHSYVELGNYKKALEILNRLDLGYLATKEESLSYTVNLCYHQIYMYINEYEKELEYAEKLLQLNPKLSVNYFRRGFAYLNLKEYENAEEDFLYALGHGSEDNSQIYINLILMYMETSKFEKALQYTEEAYKRFRNTEVQFLLDYIKMGILIKLGDFQEIPMVLANLYDTVPDNKPEFKIALLRIEGKKHSDAYNIIYKGIQRFTEDPRHKKILAAI